MKKLGLGVKSAINALLTALYIVVVALLINNGEKLFGQMDNQVFGAILFLLLFVFSAFVTGFLVLGRPIMLYLDGQKKEGLKALFYTGLSLFVILLIFLLLIIGL